MLVSVNKREQSVKTLMFYLFKSSTYSHLVNRLFLYDKASKNFCITNERGFMLNTIFFLISMEKNNIAQKLFGENPIAFSPQFFSTSQTLALFLYIICTIRLCVRTRSKSTFMGAGILMLSLCKSCGFCHIQQKLLKQNMQD